MGVVAAFMIAAGSAFGQVVVDGRIINQDQVERQPEGGIKGVVYGPNGLCDQYRAKEQAEAVKPGMKPEGQWHQLHGADTPYSQKAYGAAMNIICPQPEKKPAASPAPGSGKAMRAM